MTETVINKAKTVRLVVFDVDGVLTNGSLILGDKGDEYKVFHVHDGLGLVMLREAGLEIAVISARSSPIVAERMATLGIDYVYQGQSDKQTAITELMQKTGVNREETAYVGDDLIDLPAMNQAGLAIAVANAQPLVLQRADWVTEKAGGQGAVREVCEMILKAQGLLETAYQRYLPG
ncbi:MAG: 3-deoxy-manno-octulosonate-8-phosphatase KdsC [Gammaproteobacteria bacterium]|jgi:3-deoxy-D-manno-octulosonate 8-phosphate phosphatase (KDO 8-P phosphatase)|nr:3-deoxy-manno-octulosonate-8-phosphatase KdsC [Gammaproteobacteria bacterium]